MKLKLKYGLVSALIVLGLAWVGGFDFDSRGFTAWYVALCTLLAFGLGHWALPAFLEDEDQ